MWLVNNDNKLDYHNNLNLVEFRDTGLFVNREVVEPLESLLEALKEYTEDKLLIMSTYRDKSEQEDLYKEDSSLAAKVGYSEHETGLALDLYVHTLAQKNFIKSQVGKWVNSNAHKYGFIIRYPFLEIPKDYKNIEISKDNKGGYIINLKIK